MTIGLFFAVGCGGSTGDKDCNALTVTTFLDADGDGYGEAGTDEESCGNPEGRSAQAGDCDDSDAEIFPGNFEFCDGLDNDCTGVADDDLPTAVYYPDTDGDTYGDHNAPIESCMELDGHVLDDTDCDDTDAEINIDGVEVCDGADNDCNGQTDDDDPAADPATMQDWYMDSDADGFGGGGFVTRCDGGSGATTDNTDCDDTNPDVNPNGLEVCGGLDEDCDTLIDDADPDLDLTTRTTWWIDNDADGYGDVLVSVDACSAPSGYADNADDCDDTDPIANIIDDWTIDADGDRVGTGPVVGNGCYQPYPGTTQAWRGDDCDDTNPDMFPGNEEVCDDGVDQDCSGDDQSCIAGSFNVHDGDAWGNNPPVYTCLEACALLFGGTIADYECSTSDQVVDNLAYLSGWGDATYCTTGADEDFKREDAANPGYDCGVPMCSYSAYVADNCAGAPDTYCWHVF